MPFLVAVHRDGTPDMTAAALQHDGHTYPGPVFDVPPAVADELVKRAVFRYATVDEATTVSVKPVKAAPKKTVRKTSE